MMFFVISSVFRGAGDAVIAMRVLSFSIFVNIVLDPLLIFGLGPFPRLGVAGAAIASVTGRGLGVIAQLFFLCRGSRRLRIKVRDLRLDTGILRRLLNTSLTGMLQYSVVCCQSFWIDSNHRDLRQQCRRRLYDCDSSGHIRTASMLGSGQCSCHPGRAESGSGQAKSG